MVIVKTRAVPKKWLLLIELYVKPDGSTVEQEFQFGWQFANGETLFALRARKLTLKNQKVGVARLYKSSLGHPKVRSSRGVEVSLLWQNRVECRQNGTL